MGAIDRLRSRLSPVNSGLILTFVCLAGLLTIENRLYIPFAVLGAIGAILVLGSERTDSTWSFSLSAILGAWTLLLLADMGVKLALVTFLTFTWFVVTADIDATVEIYSTGKTGAAAAE